MLILKLTFMERRLGTWERVFAHDKAKKAMLLPGCQILIFLMMTNVMLVKGGASMEKSSGFVVTEPIVASNPEVVN